MTKNLYVFVSAGLALLVTQISHEFLFDMARDAVEMTQKAPYQYRILFAFTWFPLARLTGSYIASWLFWFLSFTILAVLIEENGRRLGLDLKNVRIFTLAAFVITPMAIYFNPAGSMWNILEAIFVAIALLLILGGRYLWLYPLVVVAAMNRETAVIIPLMFFLMTRDWKHTIGLSAAWLVTYGGIRLIIGPVSLDLTLAEILAINLGEGLLPALMGLAFVGWMFWYGWQGWRTAPEPLKRAGYVIPAYLALVAVFGIWKEWRLLITMYPLLVLLAGVEKGGEEISG